MERLRTVKGGENGDRQKQPMTGSDFLRRHYPDQVRRVTSQPRSVSEAPLRNDMEYTHDDSDCQDAVQHSCRMLAGLRGLRAQSAGAQVGVEPGCFVRRQVGGRRRLPVIDPQIVARVAIHLVQQLGERQRRIRVGAAQRHRHGRQRSVERADPDIDGGPAFSATEEDEVGRGGERVGARQARTPTAAQQVDFEQMDAAAKQVLPLLLVSVGAVGSRALVGGGEEFDSSDKGLVGDGAEFDTGIASGNVEERRAGERRSVDGGGQNGDGGRVAFIDADIGNERTARGGDLNLLKRDVGGDLRNVPRRNLLLEIVTDGADDPMVDIGPQA